jgi:vacuolar-type H+-ATPase subunit H
MHGRCAVRRVRLDLAPKSYAVRPMVADQCADYASVRGTGAADASQPAVIAAARSFLQEIPMSTQMKKLNHKLDKLADKAKDRTERLTGKAKDGAEKLAGKVIDSANDVAHSAAEKARLQTKKAGKKLIETGEKIVKLAK